MSARNIVWITWERQRRSVTLAGQLGARLFVLLNRSDDIRSRVLRYAYLLPKTLYVLVRERPGICCCQNPSLLLALALGLLRPFFRYRLVVDRHSNFNLGGNTGLKWWLFDRLSNLSLRLAEVTIVTNDFLASHVRSVGGHAFVLQDRIPSLNEGTAVRLEGTHNVVFVCGFGRDEAIEETFEAARSLDASCRVYVTGNYRAHLGRFPILREPPSNVRLTGFLDDSAYQTLLASADIVLVLTKHEHTLTCGAYEAVALGKPVVASDTNAMSSYFHKGFIFTQNSAGAIAGALKRAIAERPRLEVEVKDLRHELEAAWQERFTELMGRLGIGSSHSPCLGECHDADHHQI